MEMIKKLAMLVVAIILGGLGYAAYQHHTTQPLDNVMIQNLTPCQEGINCNCIGGLCR